MFDWKKTLYKIIIQRAVLLNKRRENVIWGNVESVISYIKIKLYKNLFYTYARDERIIKIYLQSSKLIIFWQLYRHI
jgi:hypothetical protein